jgi:hypothetical protein
MDIFKLNANIEFNQLAGICYITDMTSDRFACSSHGGISSNVLLKG